MNKPINPANEDNDIIKLLFELGHLRRIKNTGFPLAGVELPTNNAEHTARVAQIGYLLAKFEKADAAKVAVMCLFHDTAESRVGDANRVAIRYFNYSEYKKAEKDAFSDQVSSLPLEMRDELIELKTEMEKKESLEALCTKDADYLEYALTAKEYIDIGYKNCQDWINNIKKALKTRTAKDWLNSIEKTDSQSWWANLKKLDEVLK